MRRYALVLALGIVMMFGALAVTTPTANAGQKSRLSEAVRAYSKAFLGGQAKKAWLMRTERANAGLTYIEFRAICLQAHQVYADAVMTSLHVGSLKGGRAKVSYTYDISDIDQSHQPWRLVNGHWKYDRPS
jgi:hypothetical protein